MEQCRSEMTNANQYYHLVKDKTTKLFNSNKTGINFSSGALTGGYTNPYELPFHRNDPCLYFEDDDWVSLEKSVRRLKNTFERTTRYYHSGMSPLNKRIISKTFDDLLNPTKMASSKNVFQNEIVNFAKSNYNRFCKPNSCLTLNRMPSSRMNTNNKSFSKRTSLGRVNSKGEFLKYPNKTRTQILRQKNIEMRYKNYLNPTNPSKFARPKNMYADNLKKMVLSLSNLKHMDENPRKSERKAAPHNKRVGEDARSHSSGYKQLIPVKCKATYRTSKKLSKPMPLNSNIFEKPEKMGRFKKPVSSFAYDLSTCTILNNDVTGSNDTQGSEDATDQKNDEESKESTKSNSPQLVETATVTVTKSTANTGMVTSFPNLQDACIQTDINLSLFSNVKEEEDISDKEIESFFEISNRSYYHKETKRSHIIEKKSESDNGSPSSESDSTKMAKTHSMTKKSSNFLHFTDIANSFRNICSVLSIKSLLISSTTKDQNGEEEKITDIPGLHNNKMMTSSSSSMNILEIYGINTDEYTKTNNKKHNGDHIDEDNVEEQSHVVQVCKKNVSLERIHLNKTRILNMQICTSKEQNVEITKTVNKLFERVESESIDSKTKSTGTGDGSDKVYDKDCSQINIIVNGSNHKSRASRRSNRSQHSKTRVEVIEQQNVDKQLHRTPSRDSLALSKSDRRHYTRYRDNYAMYKLLANRISRLEEQAIKEYSLRMKQQKRLELLENYLRELYALTLSQDDTSPSRNSPRRVPTLKEGRCNLNQRHQDDVVIDTIYMPSKIPAKTLSKKGGGQQTHYTKKTLSETFPRNIPRPRTSPN